MGNGRNGLSRFTESTGTIKGKKIGVQNGGGKTGSRLIKENRRKPRLIATFPIRVYTIYLKLKRSDGRRMIRKVEPRKDSRGSITDDSKKPLDRKLEETFLIR